VGSDGREAELIPGGSNIAVTWRNREQFVQALVDHRKNEFQLQTDAMRRGLLAVVPASYLALFSWQQLRRQICGVPRVDIPLLKLATQYEGCEEREMWIARFWKVLEMFDDNQRAQFIRFVSGRSRIPARLQDFDKAFRIKYLYTPKNPDLYLPVSHTCFFALDLPKYSSLEIMHEKLLYAITNCNAIDGDMTENARQAFRAGQNRAVDAEDDEPAGS